MNGVHHGVDVSWLHHNGSNKDLLKAKKASPKLQQPASPPSELRPETNKQHDVVVQPLSVGSPPASASSSNATPSKSAKKGLLRRTSLDKLSASVTSGSDESKSSKRPGWISSLSSRFSSSQTNVTPTTSGPGSNSSSKPNGAAPLQTSSSKESSAVNVSDGAEEVEDVAPYVPQQPKTSNFLSSALRRLSSSSQQGRPNQAALQGHTCPRRVLNVDKNRERTTIKELDQKKLRRVAFSVDVEVVGVSRYAETEETVDAATQAKDKKLQARSEGEALKRPRAFDDRLNQQYFSEDDTQRSNSRGSVDDIFEGELLAAAKKQEQEAARQRRHEKKERKRRESESTRNSIQGPLSPTSPTSPQSGQSQTPEDPNVPAKSHDKPTTDPLRMYRRCCQLREAPVLKRISEQLGKAKPEVEKTGIVDNLDLNGSRLQLADMACLGDWLAIVPVRRLQLDNANLTDEGLRIILAGLLAAKPPELAKRKHTRSISTSDGQRRTSSRTGGVIEKLSVRLNSKITSEGWRHICLFLNLCHSLKALDLALTPFPASQSAVMAQGARESPEKPTSNPGDIAHVLFESLSRRSNESKLEELIMSQCGLNTYTVAKIIDAVCESSVTRLGLANNQLDHEAIAKVAKYLQTSTCKGLDIGGNDLRDAAVLLTEALTSESSLMALSLADCNLDPPTLARFMPALLPAKDFRFLDLSHNRELFSTTPNALATLRRYLPQLKALRRIHLTDTAMLPEQAIGIAEIVPEIRNINHVSFLENPELNKLATATDQSTQEDSCAYYASLMWAARLSKTLLAIDMHLPSSETNEVIQSLGKTIDAYLFRNIDRFTAVDAVGASDPYSILPDQVDPAKEVVIPDVLAHLVGHDVDPNISDVPTDTPVGPNQDYLVGGTGVVKALSYVLSQKSADLRKSSGQGTPTQSSEQQETNKAQSRNMIKTMLGSARKIRCRLQVMMRKEAEGNNEDEFMQRRLQFLDHTLRSMISRFESEYPDCCITQAPTTLTPIPFTFCSPALHSTRPQSAGPTFETGQEPGSEAVEPAADEEVLDNVDDQPSTRSRTDSNASANAAGSETSGSTGMLGHTRPKSIDVSQLVAIQNAEASGEVPFDSRRASVASIAARAQTQEEGQMHRFGQKIRRDVLPPRGTDDFLHKTSSRDPAEPEYLQALRKRLEQLGGDEIRESVLDVGLEATVKRWGDESEKMRRDSTPI
ncbi:MAG: hypothetical protein Q9162_002918 [Coniocarpon cinnabarinum]